jgi:hypothetical protein
MAYKLNKTDGTLLTELVDGQIDTTTCDITLIGRNYVGFGEAFNENLIKLLENFASSGAPTTPIVGQLWYDRSEGRLKVYDGTGFKSNGSIVSNERPSMVAGDIWINNSTDQLYFYDGTDTTLVGPVYENAQGKTGWEVDTVRDRSAVDHTLLKMYVGEDLVAFISNEEYQPTVEEQSLLQITGNVKKGINVINEDEFRFYGIADATNSLVTDKIDPDTGLRVKKTASQFLPSDADGETSGSLTISDSGGLTIGNSGETRIFITADATIFQNTALNDQLRIRLLGNIDYDGIVLDPQTRRMGVNLATDQLPTASLDVNGDVVIRGDLTVQGANQIIEATTVTIDDFNIELGHTDAIITLTAPLNSAITGQLTVGEVITQSSSGATASYKRISEDRSIIYLEPISGLFTVTSDSLTAATNGVLYQENGSTPVYVNSASQRNNDTANGAGITVKGVPGSNTDKTISWINDTINGTNWELNDNVNLVDGKAYKINDVTMIQENSGQTYHELGTAIETALGIRDVGIMDRLRVHNSMTLDEISSIPTITTTSPLTIDSAGTVTFKNSASTVLVTGLATTNYDTGNLADAANKDYVDTQMESATVSLALDTTDMPQTGFGSVTAQVIDILDFLHPAAEKRINTYARVHTTSLRGAVSNIDVENSFSSTSIGADFSDINTVEPYGVSPTGGGSPNQQLISNIGFTGSTSGDVTLKADDGATPTAVSTRVKRFFKVVDVGGTNTWSATGTGPNGETP